MTHRPRLARFVRAAAVASILGVPATRAAADAACRPVLGHFTSTPAADCQSPVGFCTAGRLIGGIQGTYRFTMYALAPAGDPNPPGVMFYTGRSEIRLDRGGAVFAADAGAIDLDPAGSGKMSALLSILGGADGREGARGWLHLRGSLDLASGGVTGEYVGEICSG